MNSVTKGGFNQIEAAGDFKMKSETRYFLRRASEEAHRAMSSEEPKAAEVHETLSVRYSAKALALLVAEDEEESAS